MPGSGIFPTCRSTARTTPTVVPPRDGCSMGIVWSGRVGAAGANPTAYMDTLLAGPRGPGTGPHGREPDLFAGLAV